ncbi:phage major capsid protein [Campylobacter sp. RM12637]|uniref:phage major capsid protein n=1 Tax=Campylobacter sp. RM12637 TaxID=2735734 RepID=UPI0030145BF1|nr:phage major capsid protein [Campylobacter sp. RM12637]
MKDYKLSAKALSHDDEKLEICFMALSKDNKHERTEFFSDEKYFLSIDISSAKFNATTLYLDHEPSFGNAIGKITQTKHEQDGIKCKVQFFKEVEQSYQAYLKFKNGLSDSVSVGARADDYEVITEVSNGVELEHIILKNAEIYELSAVWLGADPNAKKINQFQKETKMAKKFNDEDIKKDDELEKDKEELEQDEDKELEDEEDKKELKSKNLSARLAEQQEIAKAGKLFGKSELASEFIAKGKSLAEFKDELLLSQQREIKTFSTKGAGRSMSDCEFSLAQAIKHQFGVITSNDLRFNLSDYQLTNTTLALPKSFGHQFANPMNSYLTDNLKGATHSEFRADLLVEQMRIESDILNKCFMLSGLDKEVEIPRNLTQLKAEKVAYGTEQASQDLNFDVVKISPTTLRITVKLTQQMLFMSDFDLEQIVWRECVKAFKSKFESMILYEGYGEAGKFAGLFATNKIARENKFMTAPTFAKALNFENALISADYDPSNTEFYANKTDINTLRTTEKEANTGVYLIDKDNTLVGSKISHCQTLKRGDVVFGDFSNLALATFGNLRMSMLPQTAGLFVLEAFYDVGMGLLNENAFCLSQNVIA